MRVCQFRHSRTEQKLLYNGMGGLSRGKRKFFQKRGIMYACRPGRLEWIFRKAAKNEGYTVLLPLRERQKGGSCAADCSMIPAS